MNTVASFDRGGKIVQKHTQFAVTDMVGYDPVWQAGNTAWMRQAFQSVKCRRLPAR